MLELNLNQLYYFYVVATEGSIKEATKKLHVTQPTISNQIKELEGFLEKSSRFLLTTTPKETFLY